MEEAGIGKVSEQEVVGRRKMQDNPGANSSKTLKKEQDQKVMESLA